MRVRKLPVEPRRWSRSWTVWIQASAVVCSNLSDSTGSCPWSYVFLITGVTWNPPVKGKVVGLGHDFLSPYSFAVMARYSLQTKLPLEIWPYISVLTQNWVMRFLYFQLQEPLTPLKVLCEVSPRKPHHSMCLPFPFLSLKGPQRRQSMKCSLVDPRILLCKESSGLGATHFLYITGSISTKSLSVWSQLCDNPFPELLHRTASLGSLLLAGCSLWPRTASIQMGTISNLHKASCGLAAVLGPVPSPLWALVLPAWGNWAIWLPRRLLTLWFIVLLRSLCGWRSSLHALCCFPAWSAFETSRESCVPGNPRAWEERALGLLWRLDVTVSRQILAVSVRPKADMAEPRLIFSTSEQEKSRSPSGSMCRENSNMCTSIFSPWPDHG